MIAMFDCKAFDRMGPEAGRLRGAGAR